MVNESDLLIIAPVTVLIAGLLYAAIVDVKTREVSDALWVVLAVVGAGVGFVVAVPYGTVPTVLWAVVAALVIEHLVPWDVRLEEVHPALPGALEIFAYAATLAVLVLAGLTVGIGPSALPVSVIAVFLTVVVARALFEAGILYGGADAKALMVAGILVPILATALIPLPSTATNILSYWPFPISLLMNAALFSLAVPIALALTNLRHREFEFPRGFTGYKIPVRELPRRFVWLRDPTFSRDLTEEEKGVETADEDQALRERQMQELLANGVTRVWVTPQIPFVVLLTAGAIATVLAGNLIFDLLSLL